MRQRNMNSKEFLIHLDSYIQTQEEIAGNWDGDTPKGEDEAMIAKERMEAAQTLRGVITEYDL